MRSQNNPLNGLTDKKIAVLAGGPSNEREISFKSAENVYQSLIKQSLNAFILDVSDDQFFNTSFDIGFNCVHGKWGEDGCLQGYLEMKGVPYTGPGVMATSVGLNKPVFKTLIEAIGIKTAKQVHPNNGWTEPFVAKLISSGSSIGVHIINSSEEWVELQKETPDISSNHYFYEAYIPGREVTVGVIDINQTAMALPVLEIQTKNEFYDFHGKYTPGQSNLIVPADIDSNIENEMKQIAMNIYQYFNCKGCIRVDMIFNDSGIYVLEMNTSPGLTQLSDIPAQAKAAGISFDELVLIYLQSAST